MSKLEEYLKELRNKTEKELIAGLGEQYRGLTELRFSLSLNKEKDVQAKPKARRRLARALTILREKKHE